MGRLLFLFVLIPAVELVLLIKIGAAIGALETIALIVITGTVGATLARAQGLSVLHRVQAETAAGRVPTASLLDGVIILVAGALLITPGVLTDIVGFLCLIPWTRLAIKKFVWSHIQRGMVQGRFHVHVGGQPVQPTPPEDKSPPPNKKYPSARVYDVEPEYDDG